MRNACNAQGPKTNDSSTKKRRCVQVVESIAQQMDEVRAGDDGRGISPVNIVSGKGRIVAEVLMSVEAKSARAIGAAEPRNADARSDGECNVGRGVGDDADDLVPRHDRRVVGLEVTLDDVEIGAANTARSNRDENLARLQRRDFALLDVQPVDCDRTRGMKHRCGLCCAIHGATGNAGC
jgi:hypothetical protein